MTAERISATRHRPKALTALLVVATISLSWLQPTTAGATSTSADFTFVPPAEGRFVAGTPIEFRDQSIGAAWVYWNFGDGSSSRQRNPHHAFTEGEHWITYSVCASNSDCSTVRKPIQVAATGTGAPQPTPGVDPALDTDGLPRIPEAVREFTATKIDAKTIRLAWKHSGENLDVFAIAVIHAGNVEMYRELESHERWLLLTEMPTNRRYEFNINVYGPAVNGIVPVSAHREAAAG